MKKALVVSIFIHVLSGFGLGFWICPWFERVIPERYSVVDLDVEVVRVGEKSSGGGAERHQKSSVKKASAVAPAESVPVKPVQASVVPAQPASPLAAVQDSDQVSLNEGGGVRVLSIADYVRLVTSRNPQAPYPRLARIRNEQGRVLVRVVVSKTGSPPESVSLEESSGSEILDRSALEMARGWKYPAFEGGRSSIVMSIPFRFRFE